MRVNILRQQTPDSEPYRETFDYDGATDNTIAGVLDYINYQPYCSSIVQPVDRIAETAVDIVLSKDRASLPALTCIPVEYRPGGTTRET